MPGRVGGQTDRRCEPPGEQLQPTRRVGGDLAEVFRKESGRVIATLIRYTGDIDTAEEGSVSVGEVPAFDVSPDLSGPAEDRILERVLRPEWHPERALVRHVRHGRLGGSVPGSHCVPRVPGEVLDREARLAVGQGYEDGIAGRVGPLVDTKDRPVEFVTGKAITATASNVTGEVAFDVAAVDPEPAAGELLVTTSGNDAQVRFSNDDPGLARPDPVALDDGAGGESGENPLLRGFLIQISNPKVVVFFGSIFIAMLPGEVPGWMIAALRSEFGPLPDQSIMNSPSPAVNVSATSMAVSQETSHASACTSHARPSGVVTSKVASGRSLACQPGLWSR
jgi:hypothetical protein